MWLWRWTHKHEKEHEKLMDLPKKVDDLNLKVGTLIGIELERTPGLYDKLKAFVPVNVNPYDPARKSHLLDKMRDGTIRLEEAQELERMLREDLDRASAGGAGVGVGIILAILAALGALAAIIYLLTRED